MEFKKATLQEVSSKPSASPQTVGAPIDVQINPATLRIQMANNVDMGKAFARPNTQYQGSSSSTLTFDLIFDTADEGSTEQPVDVRTRTRQLERFLLPGKSSPKAVPPRVQFTYGTLTIVGVMSALNQELDFFSQNGVPLRAKCAVTIKEQKPEFDANLSGPGANTGAGAQPPVPPIGPGGPDAPAGATPSPPPDRTGTALEGESAAGFASRMGLDPAAWKGLAAGLDDPLRIGGGTQIDFSASLSVDAGLGVQRGATAGAGGAEPTRATRPTSAVPAQAPATGTALTAAGGLTRALDRTAVARATSAAGAARDAFTGSGPGATLRREPAPAPAGASAAAPAAAAVTLDPRAASFGFGVPLRARRGTPTASSAGLVHERARALRAAPSDGIPETDDPTVPRWMALPPHTGTRAASRQRSYRPCACGCGKAS